MIDNFLFLSGNLVDNPVRKDVGSGRVVTEFRFACNNRRLDPTTREWRDGDPLYIRVSCWNALAERVARTLVKGDPATVTGRLRMESFEVEGKNRTTFKMDAQHVGQDLGRVSAGSQRLIPHSREGDVDPFSDGGDHDENTESGLLGEEALASTGPLVSYADSPAF